MSVQDLDKTKSNTEFVKGTKYITKTMSRYVCIKMGKVLANLIP